MIKKSFITVFTISLLVASVLVEMQVAEIVEAKPSVPQFTLLYVNGPTTTNSTYPNFFVSNSIEVIITNQNFTSYFDSRTNSTISLYYNIRVKNHNENNWIDINQPGGYPTQSNNFDTLPNNTPLPTLNLVETILPMPSPLPINASVGDRIDFQVQAIIGNVTEIYGVSEPLPSWWIKFYGEPTGVNSIAIWSTIETSDWSNTQTITIPEISTSSPTPTVPELSWLAILPLLFSMLFVVVILMHRKTTELKQ
jgi:hypothetical protein